MENLNLVTLAKNYSDEASAWEFFEQVRWPDGPICPHCGTVGEAYKLGAKKTRQGKPSPRRVWKCRGCRKEFTVLVGTVFERTHVPLSKWLLGLHLFCAAKNGVSAHEISRQLGVTLKTGWFMMHRLREAAAQPPLGEKLEGVIEMDETYWGGRRRGTPRGRPGIASHKTPVVVLVQRDGVARAEVVTQVNEKNLGRVLRSMCIRRAQLMTDELRAYRKPGREFASHETVTHSRGEYARGRVYSNTAESFFAQFKGSLHGTHHAVSKRHLHRYASEFAWRWSTRKQTDGERTVATIRASQGKRLRYDDPKATQVGGDTKLPWEVEELERGSTTGASYGALPFIRTLTRRADIEPVPQEGLEPSRSETDHPIPNGAYMIGRSRRPVERRAQKWFFAV